MNQDKARDFFSAYFEGALEPGIKQSFEAALKSDANLHADYAAFVETVRELDQLKNEEIEIPIFLSDRIATRLEQVQSKQRISAPVWSTWLRGLAIGGVAVASIVFALPLFRGSSDTATAGPGTSNLDQIQFKYDGSKVELLYQPSVNKVLVVSSAQTGKEVKRFNLDHQRIDSPIENPLKAPVLFKVEAIGDRAASLIAVPGSDVAKQKQGAGTIQDLALALSGHYHVPIVIEAADVTHHVSWTLAPADARSAANQALETEGFSVDQRPDGLVRIFDR